MRTYIAITAIFLCLLLLGVSLKASSEKPEEQKVGQVATTTEEEIKVTVTEKSPAPEPKPIPLPSPQAEDIAPAQTATIATCGNDGDCTMANVTLHNTRADCWVAMSELGAVYDITPYVQNRSSAHPGPDIAEYCGTDIYDTFMGTTGEHRHSNRALNQELEPYRIATLN
jgi:hypothetical protein